jgi:hypothetical protein
LGLCIWIALAATTIGMVIVPRMGTRAPRTVWSMCRTCASRVAPAPASLTEGGSGVGTGTTNKAGGQAELDGGVDKGLCQSTQLRVNHIEPHFFFFFFKKKINNYIGGTQGQSTPTSYLGTNLNNQQVLKIQGKPNSHSVQQRKRESLPPTAHNGLILATLPSRSLTRAHIYLFLLARSVAYLLVIHL